MVILESLTVGLLGAGIGLAVSAFTLKGAAAGLEKVFPIFGTLQMTAHTWGIGLGVGVLIGVLSGLIPAINASRVRIADALRRV
jgi:putative ABC transport system permease protein